MRARVRPLLFWPVALVVVIGGAVLVAAPLHELLVSTGLMAAEADPVEANKAFLKVFRRLVLIGLAALFVSRFKPWRGGLLRYGLAPMRPQLHQVIVPFLTMVGVLFIVLAWQMLMGWLTWENPLRGGKFVGRVLRYTASGFLIALIEEWFFRGWLGEFAAKLHGPRSRLTVFMPALTYALLHAFRPTSLDQMVSHDAAGAFDALVGAFAFLVDMEAFGPAFLGLLLFAYLLTALYRRSGSLWPAIGAHAGAVMVLHSYGALTERAPARTWAGTRLLYDGPVVWAILLIGTWLLWPRKGQPGAEPDAERDDPDSAAPLPTPAG